MLQGFISYSHKDEDLCATLKECLKAFEREGRARFWSDHAIDAGDRWYPEIMRQLEAADIAVLLLSREFCASQFVYDQELPRARERWEEGSLTVVSVRLRDCYVPKTDEYKWLRDVQQVPRDGRIVDAGTRAKRDAAWTEVAKEIERTIEKVLLRRKAGITRSGEVDASHADATQAVARAMEIARQINAEAVGTISTTQVLQALGVAGAALSADPLALRDETTAAYHRLRRLKFEASENERLYDALARVRDNLMDLAETARDAGYPARVDIGLPPPKLVPREQLTRQIAEVEKRLGEFDQQLEQLQQHKQGTPESAANDAAIELFIEDADRQNALARGLMAEPLVDVAGVEAAIQGAARVVVRFVQRVASGASAAIRSVATGIGTVAAALLKAGDELSLAGQPRASAEPQSSDLVIRVRDGDGWVDERRVPGAGVPARDVVLVKGRRVPGPEMVVLPKGEFMMGSPADEVRWDGYKGEEEPQHLVRVGAFAMGRFAVTRGEFRAFVEATGHHMPDEAWTYEKDGVFSAPEAKLRRGRGWLNPGFRQDDRHPVVCVSWDDCGAYVAWLNALVSGRADIPYRLPSEAEWEYACRARTTTPFWWGSSISTAQANYDGNLTYAGGKKGRDLKRTARVDSYPPSPWGLFQMHGNVWEWCDDTWHSNYEGAPTDGSAWAGDDVSRVLRGGSWSFNPRYLRSAIRLRFQPGGRGNVPGLPFGEDVTSLIFTSLRPAFLVCRLVPRLLGVRRRRTTFFSRSEPAAVEYRVAQAPRVCLLRMCDPCTNLGGHLVCLDVPRSPAIAQASHPPAETGNVVLRQGAPSSVAGAAVVFRRKHVWRKYVAEKCTRFTRRQHHRLARVQSQTSSFEITIYPPTPFCQDGGIVMEQCKVVDIAHVRCAEHFGGPMVEAVEVEIGRELARQIADRQATPALERREQIVAGKMQVDRLLCIRSVDNRIHQPESLLAADAPAELGL